MGTNYFAGRILHRAGSILIHSIARGDTLMSLDAIEAIKTAEAASAQAKAQAQAAAKKQLAQAEEDGKNAVAQARERAAEELSALKAADMAKAREDAVKLARNTENKKAAMLAKAESRAGKAIDLVIERIVNG